MIVLAIVVGALAGVGAVAFRWLIKIATHFFTGTADYSDAGHAAHPWLPWMGRFFIVLVPVVGGLVYGPLVHRFAPEARGHGVPEVMYAINKRAGRIPARVALIKALASAITIGAGGSVGREGPIVQIGSAMGSTLARWTKLNESQVRLLVACGAAGGIAATFNAPIAGVFFALELLLANFVARAFAAVVLASVTASVIGRAAFGDVAFLSLPSFTVHSMGEYALYAVLGLLAAVVATAFVKVLYGFEDVADRLWKGPEWLRPAVGGLLLGLLLLVLPQMYGVGYPVLENAVMGKYLVGFLLLLLVGKIIATSLTIAIGGSGGVFAPALFLGATLGAGFGQVAAHAFPGVGINPGAYALVGMGAVFAGASRAPITAVIILFELTGEYSIILPLLLAVVISTMVSTGMSKESVYTAKLMRRGVDISAQPPRPELAGLTVRDFMLPAPKSVGTRMSLQEALRALRISRRPGLPVLTEHGDYVGVITAVGAAAAMGDDDAEAVTVSQLIEWREYVGPDDPIESVLGVLLGEEVYDGIPVLDSEGVVVGWLRRDSVLRRMTAQPVAPEISK
ncbi:chloride channel protein [Demequina lutea]|uniref:CIC family chloride channel protein n=1 Tax=Demequina lutea TaxID=431489 RepID=A0A7Y9ZB57_9MICO|nr:chloride channel protein [Demequina lutea]NYI41946.1 CIC family chloride channel protein [Demequina lutea]